jgi:hypothetical protein
VGGLCCGAPGGGGGGGGGGVGGKRRLTRKRFFFPSSLLLRLVRIRASFPPVPLQFLGLTRAPARSSCNLSVSSSACTFHSDARGSVKTPTWPRSCVSRLVRSKGF